MLGMFGIGIPKVLKLGYGSRAHQYEGEYVKQKVGSCERNRSDPLPTPEKGKPAYELVPHGMGTEVRQPNSPHPRTVLTGRFVNGIFVEGTIATFNNSGARLTFREGCFQGKPEAECLLEGLNQSWSPEGILLFEQRGKYESAQGKLIEGWNHSFHSNGNRSRSMRGIQFDPKTGNLIEGTLEIFHLQSPHLVRNRFVGHLVVEKNTYDISDGRIVTFDDSGRLTRCTIKQKGFTVTDYCFVYRSTPSDTPLTSHSSTRPPGFIYPLPADVLDILLSQSPLSSFDLSDLPSSSSSSPSPDQVLPLFDPFFGILSIVVILIILSAVARSAKNATF